MADGTAIEWTDATWNVINGCTVYSPGCTNCYAMKLAGTRLRNIPSRAGLTTMTKAGPVWTGETRLDEKVLLQPLSWRRPRRIFVCAHGDLFHESVPDAWIDRVFAVMALCPQHTFQMLTKRSARMKDYVRDLLSLKRSIFSAAVDVTGEGKTRTLHLAFSGVDEDLGGDVRAPWKPLPNVWLGVSVEDQERAEERLPDLIDTPAAVRWISAEPLLGPLDLSEWLICRNSLDGPGPADPETGMTECCSNCDWTGLTGDIHWIVSGGESGPGARPMHPDWARFLRDQCADAGVAFLHKQNGSFAPGEIAGDYLDPEKRAKGYTWFNDRWDECWSEPEGHRDDEPDVYPLGKKRAGRMLDGVLHDGFPA